MDPEDADRCASALDRAGARLDRMEINDAARRVRARVDAEFATYQVKQIDEDHFVILKDGRQLGDDRGFSTRHAASTEARQRAERQGLDEKGHRRAVFKPVLW